MDNKIVEEFKRCASDPVYFISKYIKVVHPVFGLVNFKLYPFQERIVQDVKSHRFNILRKFRQAGCTTLGCAYALWFVIFNAHKTVAILSKGEREATEFLERILIMYDELPEMFKVPVKEKNKHTLRLSNGSVIRSRASGKQSGRSIAGSLLILDEAAFIEHIDTIWAAVYPIISTGGSVFALSTVNGVGNWFHTKYTEAMEGLNEFNVIDINWADHPEYKRQEGFETLYDRMKQRSPPIDVDMWETITRKNIGYKEWLQEYECEFLGTGETYIDGEVLKQINEDINENYENRFWKTLRTWKEPHPHYDYLISVDVSLGRKADYSAFHVFNLYDGEQVASYYSNSTPINEFAKMIKTVGLMYNEAYVAVERNTIGANLLANLQEVYEYGNIMSDSKGELGFQITSSFRESILAIMEEYVRLRKVKLNCDRTVRELNTFIVTESGRVEADVGQHDDLVMSLALGCYVMEKELGDLLLSHERQVNHNEVLAKEVFLTGLLKLNDKNEFREEMKWLLKN